LHDRAVTVPLADKPGVRKLLVKQKWRPSLAMIVFAVLTTVLTLPLAGLFFFRLYENQLIRQTEAELIAQCAVLSALFESELAGATAGNAPTTTALANPSTTPEPRYTPVEPGLDLAGSDILGPRPDARAPARAPDPAVLDIGRRLQSILANTQRITLAGLRVLDARGVVIAGGNEAGLSLAHVEEVAQALRGRYSSVLRLRIPNQPPPPFYSTSRGTSVRIFAAMPVVVGGNVVAVVYGSRTPNNIIKNLDAEQRRVVAALAAVIGVTLIIGFLCWRTITRPIHALIGQMRAIGVSGRDAIRAPKHHGTRELAMLSQGLLDMAERLYDRTDYIASFAAHVSHELKSPLTSIQGAAELLRDSGDDMSDRERRKFLDNVIADTQRLTALLDRLRELARAENPQTGGCTALAPVVAATRGAFSNLSIIAEGCLDQAVGMSADNATIIFSHLADNAAQHNAKTLRIRATRAAGDILVAVTNDGDAIADNNRDKIFTPFFTTRREAGGTGMGLEIVRSILRAHRGSIRLVPADHGVAFVLTFPAA
jgi:two-component system, OmpR family, sensor histidine kinase CreC